MEFLLYSSYKKDLQLFSQATIFSPKQNEKINCLENKLDRMKDKIGKQTNEAKLLA